MSETEHYR